jgi:pyrroloquinoline quinone biosynthesis protein D
MPASPAITDTTTPRLAPMMRLQFEPAQDSWVLLYPEGLVKLNGPASEILKRCSGTATVSDIVNDLEQTFGESNLRADVLEFMGDAYGQGWIV